MVTSNPNVQDLLFLWGPYSCEFLHSVCRLEICIPAHHKLAESIENCICTILLCIFYLYVCLCYIGKQFLLWLIFITKVNFSISKCLLITSQFCVPLTEREFDPDIYCGVIDVETRKPCTRSLTCKVGYLHQNKIA